MTSYERAVAVVKKLRGMYGDLLLSHSAVASHFLGIELPKLPEVLRDLGREFETVLEIGTRFGVSTAVLACFAKRVITVDIQISPVVTDVLRAVKVDNQVVQVIVPHPNAKRWLVDQSKFDMAFIDGAHDRENTLADFEMTKRCGLVLFHDYPYSSPSTGGGHDGAGWVLDEIKPAGSIVRCPPFAYWMSPVAKAGKQ